MPRSANFVQILFTFVSLLVVLLEATGCISRNASSSDVVFMLPAKEDQLEFWRMAVEAFQEHAKISVAIQSEKPEKYYERLNQLLTSSAPPDVVLLDSTRFPEFVAKDALESLDAYLQRQKDIQPADYPRTIWDNYQYHGQCYALPNDVAVLAVAYNLNQFEVALLRPPAKNWTWQDYVRIAQELTKDRDGDGQTDLWGTALCPYWPVFVWQNGGELVDDVRQPRRSTLSNPEAQEALQFLADLQAKYKVAPSMAWLKSKGYVEAFLSERVAMIYCGRWDTPRLNKFEGRWEVATLPRGKLAANLGTGTCFSILKKATHKDKAWQLIAYLAGSEGQKWLLTGGFSTPARLALVNSPYFFGGIIGGSTYPFAEGIKFIHPMPFTRRFTDINRVWEEELAALWEGKAPVIEVTRRIDERVNQILAEEQAPTAWLLPLMPRI